MKRCVFFSNWFDGHPVKKHVIKTFQSSGWSVSPAQAPQNWFAVRAVLDKVQAADLLVLWNGGEPGCQWMRQICSQHTSSKMVVAEQGLLPQSAGWHIDTVGMAGNSSLCLDLSWVTPSDISTYEEYRERYLASKNYRYIGGGGYALAPLQVWWDTAIYLHSNYSSMEQFLTEAKGLVGDLRLVATPHPSPSTKNAKINVKNVDIIRDRSTMELACHADAFIGINSTVLLEIAMVVDGKAPINVLGRCPLQSHLHDQKRLLAACHARQIPFAVKDVNPWLAKLGIGV